LTFIRFCAFSSIVVLSTLPAAGQTPQGQPPATTATPQTTQTSQPAQPAPAPTQQPAQQKPAPDYPDPRTFTLGAFYWLTGPGIEPGIYGGSQTLCCDTLTGLGRPHRSPGVEASLPITRTGELHLEYFRVKGDTNQYAAANVDLFAAGYGQGDYLATQFQVQSAKLYLEDLLWPHKFPVAKFRVRSLWEVEWLQIKTGIDAPYLDTTGVSAATSGSHQIIFPAFGLAAEYAISPHVLLKASISGFGLVHKADIADAEVALSYRRGMWEIRGGGKANHFKTSPNSTEYMSATFAGAFVGVRWHWSL